MRVQGSGILCYPLAIVNDPFGYFVRKPPFLFPKLSTPTSHDAKYVADNANGFFYSEMHWTVLFPELRRSHSQETVLICLRLDSTGREKKQSSCCRPFTAHALSSPATVRGMSPMLTCPLCSDGLRNLHDLNSTPWNNTSAARFRSQSSHLHSVPLMRAVL
jgi:hypothetical protein